MHHMVQENFARNDSFSFIFPDRRALKPRDQDLAGKGVREEEIR
jgi:hypothetical protein